MKEIGVYKDYGNSFYEVWFEAFFNYIPIMISLFRATVLCFSDAFTQFYGFFQQLSKVNDWKKAPLLLVIEFHSHIVPEPSSETKQSVIYSEFQGRFCTLTIIININLLLDSLEKKKRLKSPTRRKARTTDLEPTIHQLYAIYLIRACIYQRDSRGCSNASGVGIRNIG